MKRKLEIYYREDRDAFDMVLYDETGTLVGGHNLRPGAQPVIMAETLEYLKGPSKT